MQIRFSHENGILNAIVSGRIDSTNAGEFGSQIDKALDESEAKEMVMDFTQLQYISSAGLRTLIKARKRLSEIHIDHVSDDVFKVLEMTGFTSLLKVTRAARKVSLDGCVKLSEGGNGKVFRLVNDEIIKVFTSKISREDIQLTLDRAKAAFLAGIPTPISYDVVDAEYEGEIMPGVVYEMMANSTLATAIYEHPDQFDEYMRKYVDLVKPMHECVVDSTTMEDIKEMYRRKIKLLNVFLTDEELSLLYALIDKVPDRDTFIHNDPHPKNIMLSGDELMFVDMDDCGKGHPIFDIASLHQDMVGAASMEKIGLGLYMHIMGFPVETGAKVWKRFAQLYFKTEDDNKTVQIEKMIAPYEAIRGLVSFNRRKFPKELLDEVLSRYRETIFPTLPEIIKSPFVWPQ